MDEQEKAFVIASIELKAEHDKKEKKKAEIMIYKLQNIKLWQKQKKQIS